MNIANLPRDKALHALAGAVVAAVIASAALHFGLGAKLAAAAGAIAALLAGIVKEASDRRDPDAEVSIADVIATACGGMVSVAALIVQASWSQP